MGLSNMKNGNCLISPDGPCRIAKKNGVLFFSGGWTVGGVERVTMVLANEFVRRGRPVVVAFYVLQDETLLRKLDPRVKVCQFPKPYSRGWANLSAVRKLLIENNIGFVLDAFRRPIFFRVSSMGLDVKVVRYHHSKPDTNGRIESASNGIVKAIFRQFLRISLWINYLLDDAYVVLCNEFCRTFLRFTCVGNGKKIVAINNPRTLTPVEGEKENILLYCGRLNEHPKRVSRVLEVWRQLCKRLPDWRLEIVGDGPDRVQYENLAKDLPRVSFLGVKDPAKYYAHAKILLLTSDYEGWPLVLVEAMCSRCVPIALGSYESAREIITDGHDGYVLPLPFDGLMFADKIEALTRDPERLMRMAAAAEDTSKRFSVKATADKWDALLERIS